MMHATFGPRYYVNPNFAIGAAPLQERQPHMTTSAAQSAQMDGKKQEGAPTERQQQQQVTGKESLMGRLKQVVEIAGRRVEDANRRGHQLRMMVDVRYD